MVVVNCFEHFNLSRLLIWNSKTLHLYSAFHISRIGQSTLQPINCFGNIVIVTIISKASMATKMHINPNEINLQLICSDGVALGTIICKGTGKYLLLF